MKPKTAPTSPKYAVEQELSSVWSEARLVPPTPRTPWAALVLLTLLFSFIWAAGLLAGAVWYVRAHPSSSFARLLPATVTTVIQQASETASKTDPSIPKAVREMASSMNALAFDQGENGVYGAPSILGQAAPLSSNGWLLSLADAWPAGDQKITAVASTALPQTIQTIIYDPASRFVFLRVSSQVQPPVNFADRIDPAAPPAAWVVSQGLAGSLVVAVQLQYRPTAIWQNCDHQSAGWVIDRPIPNAAGSAVVDERGRVIGLLGAEQRVWTVEALNGAVKTIVQRGTVDRPACGFSYAGTSDIITTTHLEGRRALIGAPAGATAVGVKGQADKAGLKAGDVLITIDDLVIDDVFRMINKHSPGDAVPIEYERAGKKQTTTIQLGALRP